MSVWPGLDRGSVSFADSVASRNLCWRFPGVSASNSPFTATLSTPAVTSRTGLRFGDDGCDYCVPLLWLAAINHRIKVIRSVEFPVLPLSRHCFGAFAAPGVYGASALLSHRSGSGAPVPVPLEKQLLAWGAAPTRWVPETDGQNRRNVCTSIESPLSVSSAATPETKAANSTNIAIFSHATKDVLEE